MADGLLIDDQDIRTMTQDSLRSAIAVVPQEVSLFHRSVLENIRYARPEAGDDAVFAAAKSGALRCLHPRAAARLRDDRRRARRQALRRAAATVGHRSSPVEGCSDHRARRGDLRHSIPRPRSRSSGRSMH